MMKLNETTFILIVACGGLLVSGCSLRENKGEDVHEANRIELSAIAGSLTYMKDKKGICYAVLNNHTGEFRSTFTFASVSCSKAGL